jgi:hypothetical protein
VPSFLIAGLGWQQAGEASLERVGGHVFGVPEIPEFAVSETMDGQEIPAVFPTLGLADQDHHLLAVEGF